MTEIVITSERLRHILQAAFDEISYDMPNSVLYRIAVKTIDMLMEEHGGSASLCCPLCGSVKVQRKAYCNVNGEPKFEGWAVDDSDHDWCPDCLEEIGIIKALIVKLAVYA